MKIDHRRQIQLAVRSYELRHIRAQLFIRGISLKVLLQKIWRDLADKPLVRMIFSLSWAGRQVVFLHKPGNTLFIDGVAAVFKLLCDPGISILPVIFLKDFDHERQKFAIFIRLVLKMLYPVVISRSWYAGYLQKQIERMLLP